MANENWRTISHAMTTLLLLIFLLIPTCFLRAATIAGVGNSTFPTSTHSAVAQEEFIRGLLLLHVFEYDAASSFIAAQKSDPGFAIAYWGEAMTFNHPVWNEVDARLTERAQFLLI